MKCPHDGDILQADKAEAHTGYGCVTCKGSWLPKSYIDAIQYSKEFDAKKFYQSLSCSAEHKTQINCPVNCGVLSTIPTLAGASYCPSCMGLWFEAKALKNMLKNQANKSDPASFVDPGNVTVGLFDILSSLFK